MKAIAFNGSPRKKGNTFQMLQSALTGAAEVGAKTEMVQLYSYTYSGCVSCFACKKIGGKSYGQCVIDDPLTPLLKKATEADVLLLGSPIYFCAESANYRSFFERLLFPYAPYDTELKTLFPRTIQVGIIHTMGVTETRFLSMNYDFILNNSVQCAAKIFGYAERVRAVETLQFKDPSVYYCPAKDIPSLIKRKQEFFPIECNHAFALGKQLALTAQAS